MVLDCSFLSASPTGPSMAIRSSANIEAFANVRLGPGTLYGAINTLERDQFIERCPLRIDVVPTGSRTPVATSSAFSCSPSTASGPGPWQ